MRRFTLVLPFLFLALAPGAARTQESAALLVRVVDQGGRPIPGATVQAGPEVEGERPEQNFLEETAADGTVRLGQVPVDRTLHLLIEKKGFFPAYRSATLRTGERREIRVDLRPGGVAVGRVVDETGRPVAGVEAVLSGKPFGLLQAQNPFPGFLREKAELRARTGPAGRFPFRDLPEGSFELELRHPDSAPFQADHFIPGGRGGDLGQFVLRRGITLTGIVTDPAGLPLAGVSIWPILDSFWLDDEGAFLPPAATTGSDGRFAIPHLPPGEISLHLCSAGFLQESETLLTLDEPVHLTLRPGARVRGRVLGPDGTPLAGATVQADQIGVDSGCVRIATPCSPEDTATTGSDGSFALGPLPPSWYNVLASAPGLVEGVVEKVRAAAGEGAEGIEIRLEEGVVLSGRILDPEGSPIAGAEVRSELSFGWTTSAADGSYRLSGIAPGMAELLAFAQGYKNAEIEIGPVDREAWVDLVLEPEPQAPEIFVEGRVLDVRGAPVEGAEVDEGGRRTWSAWDGSFELRLPGWRTRILASKPGFASGWAWIDPQEGSVRGLEIRLGTSGAVSGRVLGRTAEDAGRASVRLDQQDAPGFEAPLAQDGTFRIERVPPGSWTLTAQVGARSASTSVSLAPEQAEVSVELELPSLHPVSGRVLDARGQPVAGAWLFSHAQGVWRLEGGSRSDGSFLLRLPEGSHQLLVRREGFLPARLSFHVDGAPVDGLEARLERGAVLRGHILGLEPGEVPAVMAILGSKLDLVGSEFEIAEVGIDGDYSLTNLRPGAWAIEVQLYESGRSLRRMIEIPPGVDEMAVDLVFTAEAAAEEEKP